MKIQLTNVILVNKQYYLQKISTFDFVSMKCKRSLKGPQRLNFGDLTFVIHVIWKVFKFCTTFILHVITNYLQVKSYKGKRGQNFKFSEDWHFDPYLSMSRDAQFTSWRFLHNFNVYILSFCSFLAFLKVPQSLWWYKIWQESVHKQLRYSLLKLRLGEK